MAACSCRNRRSTVSSGLKGLLRPCTWLQTSSERRQNHSSRVVVLDAPCALPVAVDAFHTLCDAAQVPDQLRQLFEKNYELLLSIFNPQGWLDITYVDSELRVGRDDKGNLFVLERAQKAAAAGSS